jgi:peptidoglycan hydrolase-like protein with peptidoglycan-binding domain
MILVGLSLLVVGFLSGRAVLTPVDAPEVTEGPVIFTVEARTLERSVVLGGEASWMAVATWVLRRGGTVTTLPDDVAALEEGSVVATLDLEPVILAQGEIPAFRELGIGATGEDVAQLQGFLLRQGDLASGVDGAFRSGTEQAVRRWQRRVGAPVSGVVRVGDVIWVSRLPATFAFGDAIRVGAILASGEVLLDELDVAPVIVLRTSAEQVNLLPVDPDVVVRSGDHAWEGVLGSGVRTDSGIEYPIHDVSGGPVCGQDCTSLPLQGRTEVDIEVISTPTTTGPAVPQAAIITDASGETFVRAVGGGRVDIRILASSLGMSVVEGLDIGQRVLLP